MALLRDLKDPFVTLEFASKGGEALVFSRPALVAATDDILTDNGVRAQGSPDMLAVWQAKAGTSPSDFHGVARVREGEKTRRHEGGSAFESSHPAWRMLEPVNSTRSGSRGVAAITGLPDYGCG